MECCLWKKLLLISIVIECYTKRAICYDADYQSVQLDGTIEELASQRSGMHAAAQVNPRTREAFSNDEAAEVAALQPHNLVHRSYLEAAAVPEAQLPEGRTKISDCNVEELKAMVAARGGSTVSDRGKRLRKTDLVRVATAFSNVEEQAPHLVKVFDRKPETSGSFFKVNVKAGTSVIATLSLVLQADFLKREQHTSLRSELKVAHQLLQKHQFIHKHDDFALQSPELLEEMIYHCFAHIGKSTSQKNVGNAFKTVLVMHAKKLTFIAP